MAFHVTTRAPDAGENPPGDDAARASPTPGDSKPKSSKWLVYCIEGAILVLALLLGLAIRYGVYESALVISRSMEPTLQVGDRLLIDHRSSLHGAWRRGDIVLFEPPASWNTGEEIEGEPPDQLIKRVVGLPGEIIEVRPEGVSINGRVLRESYINTTPPGDASASAFAPGSGSDPLFSAPLKLGPGQYFVMGDNRANSDDSRRRGPVSDRNIQGRAVRLIGPWGRFGALPAPGYDASP